MIREWIFPLAGTSDGDGELAAFYAADSRGSSWFVLAGSDDPDEAQQTGQWIKAANPSRIRQ